MVLRMTELMKYISCHAIVITGNIVYVCGVEEDIACELTTGTVLCGSVSRALKNRRSDSRKTDAHQAEPAASDSQV